MTLTLKVFDSLYLILRVWKSCIEIYLESTSRNKELEGHTEITSGEDLITLDMLALQQFSTYNLETKIWNTKIPDDETLIITPKWNTKKLLASSTSRLRLKTKDVQIKSLWKWKSFKGWILLIFQLFKTMNLSLQMWMKMKKMSLKWKFKEWRLSLIIWMRNKSKVENYQMKRSS